MEQAQVWCESLVLWGGWRGRQERRPSPTDAALVLFVSALLPLHQLGGEKLHPNRSLQGKGSSRFVQLPGTAAGETERGKGGQSRGSPSGKTDGNRSSSLPGPVTAQYCPSCAACSFVFPRTGGVPGSRGAELLAVD